MTETRRISPQVDSLTRTLFAPTSTSDLTAYPVIADGEGSLHVALPGHLCPDNSTTTPLDVDGVYTGAWEDTVNYATIIIGVIADQNSATDGLAIEWSADGVTKTQDDVFTISANKGKVFTFCPANRYFRVKYTNGGVAQTSFNLQVIMKKTDIKGSSHRINDSIVAEDDAELVKAVITGENPAGTFVNFQSTTAGNFKVSLEELETGISSNSKSQLNITIYDPLGIPAEVDDSTHSLQTIDYNHHEIHSGSHYFISDVVDLAINNVFDMQFQTPDTTKWIHFVFSLDCEAETEWYIYETVTFTVTGTTITPFNNNRNSANTSGTIIYQQSNTSLALANADTNITGATILLHGIVGAGRTSGGADERGDEIILKQNTKYCFRAIATAAGYIDFDIDWYEHTDKN